MDILIGIIAVVVLAVIMYVLIFGVGAGLKSVAKAAKSGDWEGQAAADREALENYRATKGHKGPRKGET